MELILQAYEAAPNLRHLALPRPEGSAGYIEQIPARVQPLLENYPALLSITMGDIRLERPAAGQPFARRDPPQS
jgi:hypothetical protein